MSAETLTACISSLAVTFSSTISPDTLSSFTSSAVTPVMLAALDTDAAKSSSSPLWQSASGTLIISSFEGKPAVRSFMSKLLKSISANLRLWQKRISSLSPSAL